MADDSDETRKRRIIDEAHLYARRCYKQLEEARLGGGRVSRARRQYHVAVMNYWGEIKRFRHREHIQEQWNEHIPELGGSLNDITQRRLTSVQTAQTVEDPDTRADKEITSAQPWVMQPRTAAAVHDKLEECAHELGFDTNPERRAETTGVGAQDIDEVDHINSSIQVSANDDN